MHVDAETTLSYAASLFQNRRVKFLPILVPGKATVLALISHVEILEVRAEGGVLYLIYLQQRRMCSCST